MTEPHVISALVAKRAELSGKLLDLDRQKARLRSQVRNIDHALAIFGYVSEPRDITPVRPRQQLFKRREVPTLIRELERDGLDLSNREAALLLIDRKGWDAENAALVAKVTEAVKSAKKWMRGARERNGNNGLAGIARIGEGGTVYPIPDK